MWRGASGGGTSSYYSVLAVCRNAFLVEGPRGKMPEGETTTAIIRIVLLYAQGKERRTSLENPLRKLPVSPGAKGCLQCLCLLGISTRSMNNSVLL